jgi:small subunit ribosomal protein S11e
MASSAAQAATAAQAAAAAQAALAHQDERAFQKQPHIFAEKTRVFKPRSSGKKPTRYVKNVGLGFKTPREAVVGNYIDKKCPWTGTVSIRGRILRGVVKSTKMTRTAIIRRDYLFYVRKYNRFEKRHHNLAAHVSPAFRIKQGDVVTVGQCRPLSKTVRFNVLRVERAATDSTGKVGKKQFKGF